jgi:uncharacterized membrane protein YdjX (TVP38/TMEM64 family)
MNRSNAHFYDGGGGGFGDFAGGGASDFGLDEDFDVAGERKQDKAWKQDVATLLGLFGAGLLLVCLLLRFVVLGDLSAAEWVHMKSPTSLENVKEIGAALQRYGDAHYGRLVFGHTAVYLFLQTFAVPGTLFLNLLGGALFGMGMGLPLCILLTGVGSCCCYLLYSRLGARPLLHLAPQKLAAFRAVVEKGNRQGNMTQNLLFSFIFPFSPHWMMKAGAGILRIPLRSFAPAVTLGLVPYNVMSCKAGLILATLADKGEIWDTTSTVFLVLVALGGFFAPKIKAFTLAKLAARRGGGGLGGLAYSKKDAMNLM